MVKNKKSEDEDVAEEPKVEGKYDDSIKWPLERAKKGEETESNIRPERCVITKSDTGGRLHKEEGFNDNSSSIEVDALPDYLSTVLEGKEVPLDTSTSLDHRPEWVDDEKLEQGRKFAISNLLGVIYAEMLSLAFLLSMRGSLEALVFTGNSSTPITAFKRYLSTVNRVVSWYEEDHRKEGTKARNNIATVRAMHANVAQKMNSSSPEVLSRLISLEGSGTPIWSSPLREFQRDFEDSVGKSGSGCPFVEMASLSRKRPRREVHVNQLELAMTQFGFMGLLVLYPDKFGVTGASDSDLEAFVHLWRALGHSLGIMDKYNFCSDSLAETRTRCRAVFEKWIKPCMSEVTREWEHMYRCVVKGTTYYVPPNTYGGSLAYLCWVVGVDAPRLFSSLSWFERFMYFIQRVSLCYLCRLPGFLPFLNILLRIALWRGNKYASTWIQRHEGKMHKYQVEGKNISTRL